MIPCIHHTHCEGKMCNILKDSRPIYMQPIKKCSHFVVHFKAMIGANYFWNRDRTSMWPWSRFLRVTLYVRIVTVTAVSTDFRVHLICHSVPQYLFLFWDICSGHGHWRRHFSRTIVNLQQRLHNFTDTCDAVTRNLPGAPISPEHAASRPSLIPDFETQTLNIIFCQKHFEQLQK